MGKVIVAFERQSNTEKIREILESAGEFSCLTCRSADQVKRTVHKLRLDLVVCGFKLLDESCESMYHDLPRRCSLLMVAPQAQLDLCETKGIFKLPTPVRRSELLASVRLLARAAVAGAAGNDASQVVPCAARAVVAGVAGNDASQGHSFTRRSQEERELVEQAKQILIECGGMTEDQAHHFLQKRSMDSGARLVDTARQVLEGNIIGQ